MFALECLTIEKMPQGGFVVTDGGSRGDPGRFCERLFACTHIGEALDFIRGQLAPNGARLDQGAAICSGIGAAVKFKPYPGSTGDWQGA